MGSDSESGDESAFADSVAAIPSGRLRQVSVPEMVASAGQRKAKRPAPTRSSNSPPEQQAPDAKRQTQSLVQSATVELSDSSFATIQRMIDSASAKTITAFEAKFELLERRVEQLWKAKVWTKTP